MFGLGFASFATSLLAAQPLPGGPREQSVREFLLARRPDLRTDRNARYSLAWVDLNDDGKEEAVVRVMSEGYCGSGGCFMYVLSRKEPGWRVIGRTSITKPPIRVLNSVSHGWRQLSVFVQGGGIIHGYDALLGFDGRTYPSNPSMPPARRLYRHMPGRVLISPDDRGHPFSDG